MISGRDLGNGCNLSTGCDVHNITTDCVDVSTAGGVAHFYEHSCDKINKKKYKSKS